MNAKEAMCVCVLKRFCGSKRGICSFFSHFECDCFLFGVDISAICSGTQFLSVSFRDRDRKKLTGGRVCSVVLLNGATVLARQRRTSVLSALASAP